MTLCAPASDVSRCEAREEDNELFLSRLRGAPVDLIVSSPPYNIGKEYERRAPLDAYLDQQRHVLGLCRDALNPGAWLCWQVGNYVRKGGRERRTEVVPLDLVLMPLMIDLGFSIRRRVIWHFEHGLHSKHRFSGRHETVLCCTYGEPATWHSVSEADPGVWDIPNVKANHPEKTGHPCQFPVELAERLVLAFTNPGDRVADPYMGAGSTLIAAAKRDRIGLGCDLDPDYVRTTRDRLDQLAAGTLKTRPMGREIVRPTSSTRRRPRAA